MSLESKDSVKPSNHTLGHALGAVAGTAVDQARDLAVAQLDCWAERLRQRLEVPVAEVPAATEPVAARPVVSGLAKPLLVGALAGAAVGWLLAGRRTGP